MSAGTASSPPSSAAEQLTPHLVHHFGDQIAADVALVAESTSLCLRYNLTPEALYYKWSAHAFNTNLPTDQPFTLEHARHLRNTIAQEANQPHTPQQTTASSPLNPSAHGNRHIAAAGRHNAALSHILGGLGAKASPTTPSAAAASKQQPPYSATNLVTSAASPFQTPSRPTAHPGHPHATPASASAYRTLAANNSSDVAIAATDFDSPSLRYFATPAPSTSANFRILETLNPDHTLDGTGSHLVSARSATASFKKLPSRITLAVATDPRAWNYRYMFEKKGERSQVLDDRIDHFASMMREAYQLDGGIELGDPSMPSQEPIYVVGRICPGMLPPSSVGATGGGGARARAAAATATTTSSKPTTAAGSPNAQEEEDFAFDDPSGLPKMAETGIVLEASRMMGSGNRVPIFLQRGCRVRYGPTDPGTTAGSAATTVGLFPGQIVMLKGMNGGGERFGVEEVLMPPTLPHAASPADELQHNQYAHDKLDGKALNVVTASGPFTDEADLDFRPWHRVMDALEAGGLPAAETDEDDRMSGGGGGAGVGGGGEGAKRRGVPDVLILLGPFLSTTHAELPFSSLLPDEIFQQHISTRLNDLVSRFPSLVVVLIPSTLDILNVHAAYPQPGLASLSALGLHSKRNIKLLPNPSVFYVNELVFAATTADTLRDLKSEELVCRIEAAPRSGATASTSTVARGVGGGGGGGVSKDAMTRLTRHVLSQRSFYPLFPAPLSSGVALDVSHSELIQFPAVSPDVLILPSSIKQFVRVVESTVVVNPGKMGGAVGGPSLASFHIRPLEREEVQSAVELQEDAMQHKAYSRTRCDVVAI